jgi:hypothetical protein
MDPNSDPNAAAALTGLTDPGMLALLVNGLGAGLTPGFPMTMGANLGGMGDEMNSHASRGSEDGEDDDDDGGGGGRGSRGEKGDVKGPWTQEVRCQGC